MKVLYVLGSFYPAQNGGPNNTVFWAAQSMANNNIDVSVVTTSNGLTPNHYNDFKLKNNKCVSLCGISVHYFSYLFTHLFSLRMFYWLCRNLHTYDVVCLTSVFYPMTWFSALICILRRVPFSIAPRGELEPAAMRFGPFKKRLLWFSFISKILNQARFIVVTSEQERRFCSSFFPNVSFVLIPNYMPMDDTTLSDVSSFTSERSDLLYLGRIHPKKGIENLLYAFAQCVSLNIKLKIVGTGDSKYLDSLKLLVDSLGISESVVFLGHLEGNDKFNCYNKSKALILPSFSENFGNVVVEALSVGCPVIASIYTPWESISTHNAGFWVDNSVDSLVHSITELYSLDSDSYSSLCINAYNFSRENFDISRNHSKLIDFINRF